MSVEVCERGGCADSDAADVEPCPLCLSSCPLRLSPLTSTMMVKAVLLIYEKCSAFLSKETLFVFENCNAPSVWKIQISKMKNPNPPIIRVYWHSQTTVCFQDFSYGFTYFILNLKCSRTPYYAAPAAAKSLQLCPTLCDPVDGSPPGSAIPGILQARTLEWVAISFSSA